MLRYGMSMPKQVLWIQFKQYLLLEESSGDRKENFRLQGEGGTNLPSNVHSLTALYSSNLFPHKNAKWEFEWNNHDTC